jgi:hypothetical protein
MMKGVLPQQPDDEPMSDAKRALIAKARQIEMRQKMKGLVR